MVVTKVLKPQAHRGPSGISAGPATSHIGVQRNLSLLRSPQPQAEVVARPGPAALFPAQPQEMTASASHMTSLHQPNGPGISRQSLPPPQGAQLSVSQLQGTAPNPTDVQPHHPPQKKPKHDFVLPPPPSLPETGKQTPNISVAEALNNQQAAVTSPMLIPSCIPCTTPVPSVSQYHQQLRHGTPSSSTSSSQSSSPLTWQNPSWRPVHSLPQYPSPLYSPSVISRLAEHPPPGAENTHAQGPSINQHLYNAADGRHYPTNPGYHVNLDLKKPTEPGNLYAPSGSSRSQDKHVSGTSVEKPQPTGKDVSRNGAAAGKAPAKKGGATGKCAEKNGGVGKGAVKNDGVGKGAVKNGGVGKGAVKNGGVGKGKQKTVLSQSAELTLKDEKKKSDKKRK
ncbi:hypothetical protein ElyMa_006928500 [Elysia marginata]|uniref:Uncharacterized protein n=1 Tax=Elysia marginata TaxID=1093978 RepID=A0AAV4JM05_9GAST|nr:hypothetical protein ElyMa_006928500 [Elysia marginata]